MKNYEIMIIVKSTLSEDDTKKVIEKFSKVLTTNGAKIIETKEMGQRELAYEIKKHKSGYYYVYEIEASDDAAINEFDRLALISEDILRHLITRKEK